MHKLMTRIQARAALGDMPERTFARYVELGMPRRKVGKRGHKYPWPEFLEWYFARQMAQAAEDAKPGSYSEAMRRKVAAQAELEEFKLEKKRSEVMTIAQGADWMEDACERVRSKILELEDRLAPALVGMESAGAARLVIHEHVLAIMNELRDAADVPAVHSKAD